MPARILAFMNQKGGVGKTTTVAALGSLLAAEHAKRVLLVDLDPQCNLSDHFGVDQATQDESVFNVLIDGLDPRAVIRRLHGLDVLPASIDLGGAELLLASMMMRELRLKTQLAPLADDYDYILLDCPPSLGLLTISGLAVAQGVMIPMQAEFLALRGLAQLMKTVEIVHDHLNPALAVAGVVFCMYDARTNLAKDVRAEVERHFPDKVYAGSVRKNVRLAEAPSHGLPINLYDPTCTGTTDYREVVDEFLRREAEAGEADADAAVRAPAPAQLRPVLDRVDGAPPVDTGTGAAPGVASKPVPAAQRASGLARSARILPVLPEDFQRQPIWRGDAMASPSAPPAAGGPGGEASDPSPRPGE